VNPDDIRMGEIITTIDIDADPSAFEALKPNDLVIVGFPYDEGTARNGGRVGGAGAFDVFWQSLQRMGTVVNPEFNVDLTKLHIFNSGKIPSGLKLEEAHTVLEKRVTDILKRGCFPFVVGGSNDQSYPNASALMNVHEGKEMGVINIDAHLDVRPKKNGLVHSGSPFRLLLEDARFERGARQFVEFAAQGSQCSKAHADFVLQNGGEIVWLLKDLRKCTAPSSDSPVQGAHRVFSERLQGMARSCSHIFVSFDIDSISVCVFA